MHAIPVMAVLGVYSVTLSSISVLAKAALIAVAALYAASGFRLYRALKPFRLEVAADGALWMVQGGGKLELAHAVWRDWGYLIELSWPQAGNRHRCFWLTGCLDAVPLRRLRLLVKAKRKKAASTLPSIVTNPVL